MAVRDCEFLNCAIGRSRIDVLPVRVGGRGAVGDLGSAGQGGESRRPIFPKNGAGIRIDRDSFSVGGGYEKYIAAQSAYDGAVEIDGGGIDRAIQTHLDAASVTRYSWR